MACRRNKDRRLGHQRQDPRTGQGNRSTKILATGRSHVSVDVTPTGKPEIKKGPPRTERLLHGPGIRRQREKPACRGEKSSLSHMSGKGLGSKRHEKLMSVNTEQWLLGIGEKRGMESCCSMDAEFQFCKTKNSKDCITMQMSLTLLNYRWQILVWNFYLFGEGRDLKYVWE